MRKLLRSNSPNRTFDYLALEKRELLACDHIGDVGAGIAT